MGLTANSIEHSVLFVKIGAGTNTDMYMYM